MIDVFEPSGDPYVKLAARNVAAATTFRNAIDSRGTFNLGDLGETFDHFYGPISKKIERYSAARNLSPMIGVGMYFSCNTGNAGAVLAHLDAVRALDRAFGVDAHLGTGQLERTLAEVCSNGDSLQVLTLPFDVPLSFLMYLADKASGQKIILLVSAAILLEGHPFTQHPVVTWLREMAEA